MKRERLIRDEIESQDDFLQVSILEMLSSWQDGLDKVNAIYGTSLSVKLNPVLINELMQQLSPAQGPEEDAAAAAEPEPNKEEAAAEPEEVIDNIEQQEEIVQEVVDLINDAEEGEKDVSDGEEIQLDES